MALILPAMQREKLRGERRGLSVRQGPALNANKQSGDSPQSVCIIVRNTLNLPPNAIQILARVDGFMELQLMPQMDFGTFLYSNCF